MCGSLLLFVKTFQSQPSLLLGCCSWDVTKEDFMKRLRQVCQKRFLGRSLENSKVQKTLGSGASFPGSTAQRFLHFGIFQSAKNAEQWSLGTRLVQPKSSELEHTFIFTPTTNYLTKLRLKTTVRVGLQGMLYIHFQLTMTHLVDSQNEHWLRTQDVCRLSRPRYVNIA